MQKGQSYEPFFSALKHLFPFCSDVHPPMVVDVQNHSFMIHLLKNSKEASG